MSKCQCSMAIRMTGDGCRYCQPQEYIDRMSEWLQESREEAASLEAERDQLKAENERLGDVLRSIACSLGAGGYNASAVDPDVFEEKICWGIDALTAPLITERDTLRKQLDEACWLLRHVLHTADYHTMPGREAWQAAFAWLKTRSKPNE